MVRAHVDVLGIERCNPNLILISLLLYVVVVLRHSLKFLCSLVGLVDDSCQFLHTQRTVIVHTVFVSTEVLNEIDKYLRIGILQLLLAHDVAVRITSTIDTIFAERRIIVTLILLGILTTLQDSLYQSIVSCFIYLGMIHHILKQRQSGLHVLIQTTETDGDHIIPNHSRETASHLIELLLYLGSGQLVGT